MFQAIVSVMAVNIQFSSPRGVRLSFKRPGILHRERERWAGWGREIKLYLMQVLSAVFQLTDQLDPE